MAVCCPHLQAAPQPPIDEARSIFIGTASVDAFVGSVSQSSKPRIARGCVSWRDASQWRCQQASLLCFVLVTSGNVQTPRELYWMRSAKTMRRLLGWPSSGLEESIRGLLERSPLPVPFLVFPRISLCNSHLHRLTATCAYSKYDNDVTYSYKSLSYLLILSTTYIVQPTKQAS